LTDFTGGFDRFDFIEAGWVGDDYLACQYGGYDIGMKQDLFDEITGINNYTLAMVYNEEGQKLSCSEFFKEVQGIFQATIDGKTSVKFSLFSAHDQTLIAFLTCLGNFTAGPSKQPPFASTLFFELYKDSAIEPPAYTVNTIYNGELIQPNKCGSKVCPWADFIQQMESQQIKNYAEACKK
jgi:hypothetical protein